MPNLPRCTRQRRVGDQASLRPSALGKSFVPTLYGEGYPEDLKLGYGLSCAVRYWMSSVSRATPANIAAVVAAGSSEKRGEPEGPVWELRMWMEVACDTRRFARN